MAEDEPGPRYISSNINWPMLPHYYGDFVRQFFVGAAALMLLTAPFKSEMLAPLLPIEVAGAVALVCLAALTNPRKQWVLIADAVAAGAGVFLYEFAALVEYNSGSLAYFALREVIAVILMFGLYFSVKTVRAMVLHQIGAKEAPERLEETEVLSEDEWNRQEREQSLLRDVMERQSHEKFNEDGD